MHRHNHSKATKKKMSKAAIGNSNAKEAIRSEEYLEKQRKAQTGKRHSKATKRKMSVSQKRSSYTKVRGRNGYFVSKTRYNHLPTLW